MPGGGPAEAWGVASPGLLRLGEAARYMACSPSTLKRLVKSGALPKARISAGVVRFRLADLDAYIARSAAPSRAVSWPARAPRRRRP